MKRLEGKSALITGAARGIGRGFAEAFVAEGATVAISDINLEAASETAARIGDAAYPVQIDVGDQGSEGEGRLRLVPPMFLCITAAAPAKLPQQTAPVKSAPLNARTGDPLCGPE